MNKYLLITILCLFSFQVFGGEKEEGVLLRLKVNGRTIVLIKDKNKLIQEDDGEIIDYFENGSTRYFRRLNFCSAGLMKYNHINDGFGYMFSLSNFTKDYQSNEEQTYLTDVKFDGYWRPEENFTYQGDNRTNLIKFVVDVNLPQEYKDEVNALAKKLIEDKDYESYLTNLWPIKKKMSTFFNSYTFKFEKGCALFYITGVTFGTKVYESNALALGYGDPKRLAEMKKVIKVNYKGKECDFYPHILQIPVQMKMEITFPTCKNKIEYGKLLYKNEKMKDWQQVKIPRHFYLDLKHLDGGKLFISNSMTEVFDENGNFKEIKIHVNDVKPFKARNTVAANNAMFIEYYLKRISE